MRRTAGAVLPDHGMSKELVISIVLALAGSACHAADMDIRIDGPIVDTRLPSGSGMSWKDGRYFVVGDDSRQSHLLGQFARPQFQRQGTHGPLSVLRHRSRCGGLAADTASIAYSTG